MDGQGDAQVLQLNQLLKAALSSDASQRQQAEALIGELSGRESFCSMLVAVLKHPDAEESTKWLAAVQLKNTVNKRWSLHRVDGGPSRALADQEKHFLRSEILHLVGLKDAKAALQVALVIAKVARHDYPNAWPTLLDQLLGPIIQGTADNLTNRRIWMTLHHVVKQLATKRLPVDKRNFQQTTAKLMPVVWTSWAADSKYMQEHLPAAIAAGKGGHSSELEHRFEAWMMVTKILRRLVMNGIPSNQSLTINERMSGLAARPCTTTPLMSTPLGLSATPLVHVPTRDGETLQPNGDLCQALAAACFMFKFLLSLRPERPEPAARPHAMLEGGLLRLAKLHCTAAQVHPWALDAADALVPCLHACVDIATRRGFGGLSWRTLTSRAIRYLDLVLRSPHYHHMERVVTLRPPDGNQEEAERRWEALAAAVKAKLQAFWGPPERRRDALIEAILTMHLPLTQEEAEDWQADPEAWYHTNEGVLLEVELRGVAEIVLQEMVGDDVDVVGPQLAAALQQARAAVRPQQLAQEPQPPAVAEAARHKEAVYCAACMLSHMLAKFVNFEEWLQASLLPELSVMTRSNALLQRRCLLVIASWASSLGKQWRPAVYGVAVDVLRAPTSDVAVQLTAVATLRALVEDFDFVDEQLVPFLQPLLGHLPELVRQCSSADSHVLVFALVSSIVERMGDLVHPHAESILSWVPQVWQNGDGQGLLRMQILQLLQRLTNALGPSCVVMQQFVLGLLDYSLNIDGPEALSLVEDALLLWLVTLRNAPADARDALRLWPHWVKIMSTSIEHVQSCMMIASSAVLLGQAEFLQACGQALAETVAACIGDLKSMAMVSLYHPMIYIIQIFGADAMPLLAKPLTKLLHVLLSGEEEVLSWVKGVGVIARGLLHCPQATAQLFADAQAQGVRRVPKGQPPSAAPPAASGAALLAAFLADVADNFDAIAQPADRKLCAMAAAAALALPVPEVLEHVEALAAAMTAVWEAQEGGGNDFPGEYAWIGADPGDYFPTSEMPVCLSEDAQGESERVRQVNERDPVRNVKLGAWCKQCLHQALEVHQEALRARISALPPVLSESLQQMVK